MQVSECYSRWHLQLPLGFKWLEVAAHKWLYVFTISDEDFLFCLIILHSYISQEEGGKNNTDSC